MIFSKVCTVAQSKRKNSFLYILGKWGRQLPKLWILQMKVVEAGGHGMAGVVAAWVVPVVAGEGAGQCSGNVIMVGNVWSQECQYHPYPPTQHSLSSCQKYSADHSKQISTNKIKTKSQKLTTTRSSVSGWCPASRWIQFSTLWPMHPVWYLKQWR